VNELSSTGRLPVHRLPRVTEFVEVGLITWLSWTAACGRVIEGYEIAGALEWRRGLLGQLLVHWFPSVTEFVDMGVVTWLSLMAACGRVCNCRSFIKVEKGTSQTAICVLVTQGYRICRHGSSYLAFLDGHLWQGD
jgi:hypothetical protein